MGRECRRVPSDWEHPKNSKGHYLPLFDGDFASADKEWMEGWQKWQQGLCENYGEGAKWKPIEPEYVGTSYTDYAGGRPSPDEYMPDWPDEQCTHFMMYENTSEGTPISPAFATAEELALWLVDNRASAFAGEVASYEAWLRVANGGFACSAVVCGGVMQSGVEALTEQPNA